MKVTKEETLDFFDECNKKSHIATKKFKKFKRKLETWKKKQQQICENLIFKTKLTKLKKDAR